MDHDALAHLRRHSAAWRLLASDNAALVLAFLGGVFVDDNVREIGELGAGDPIGRLPRRRQ